MSAMPPRAKSSPVVIHGSPQMTSSFACWSRAVLYAPVEPEEEGGRYTFLGDPTEACLLVRADVPPLLEGSPVRELTAVGEIQIIALSHDNETYVPTQGTVLEHGDIIYAAVAASAAGKFRSMLGLSE